MKRVTLIVDDDFSDVITITAIGVRGKVTNVTVSAHEIKDGDIIHALKYNEAEVQTNENH